MEQTFTMVKPDSVARGETSRILARMEAGGFVIRRLKMVQLSAQEARAFYHVHEGKPFLDDLVAYMSSGPAVVIALERDGAIAHWRAVMGATNPADAEDGTLRKLFGESIERNATHGSDAPETAAWEIAFFFSHLEFREGA